MSSALLWDTTQPAVELPYRHVRQPVGREIQEGFLDFLNLEDGTETFSRNVFKELPVYAA